MLTLDNTAETALSRALNDSDASLATVSLSCGRYTGTRWYCIWTLPQREFAVRQAILDRSWNCYLPLCTTRRAFDRYAIVPLFPRYAFVEFDATTDQWGSICRTPGVGGIIRHGWETPTPLPHGIVEHLLSRTSERGVVDDTTSTPPADIPLGASVSVLQGPLAGLTGICSRTGPERVLVLLRLFQGSVQVSIPRAALQVVA